MNMLAVVPATAPAAVTLTVGGMLIMLASVVLVLGLNVFCLWRILHAPEVERRHHAPLDIDTGDLD